MSSHTLLDKRESTLSHIVRRMASSSLCSLLLVAVVAASIGTSQSSNHDDDSYTCADSLEKCRRFAVCADVSIVNGTASASIGTENSTASPPIGTENSTASPPIDTVNSTIFDSEGSNSTNDTSADNATTSTVPDTSTADATTSTVPTSATSFNVTVAAEADQPVYNCTCLAGYSLDANSTCQADECGTGNATCGRGAKCVKREHHNRCKCFRGYRGYRKDGKLRCYMNPLPLIIVFVVVVITILIVVVICCCMRYKCWCRGSHRRTVMPNKFAYFGNEYGYFNNGYAPQVNNNVGLYGSQVPGSQVSKGYAPQYNIMNTNPAFRFAMYKPRL